MRGEETQIQGLNYPVDPVLCFLLSGFAELARHYLTHFVLLGAFGEGLVPHYRCHHFRE